MTPSNLLQVLSGTATPPTLALQAGVELAPQSLGRTGMWFVDGDGVLDVHGYVYWDGAQLFVQSHDPQQPIFSGGVPVPLDWTPVVAPVILQLGHVQISFSAVGAVLSDAPTQLGQSAGFAQGLGDLHAIHAAATPVGAAPNLLGAPIKAATVPPPGGKAAASSSLKNPKQALMLGAIVLLLGGAGWMMFQPPPPPPPAAKTAVTTPTATTPTVAVVAPPAPREAIPLVPATPLAKGAVASPTELRLAIDALLAGRDAEAARLFDALASKYPGHPELQASALLLRGLRPAAK